MSRKVLRALTMTYDKDTHVSDRDTPVAVFVNPKTFELCVVTRYRGNSYRIGLVSKLDEYIGDCYTAESGGPDDSYLRIHSPSGLDHEYRGKAYGMLLYCGAAIGVDVDEQAQGVFSVEGMRSRDADRLWNSMVKSNLAERSDPRDDSTNHCESVSDSDTGDGGRITDDEVCGDVHVEYPGSDVLVAGVVRREDFFFADGNDLVNDQLPIDLVLRVRVGTREAAERYAEVLRNVFGSSVAQRYLQTAHVLELFGQGRLPGVRGLGSLSALFGADPMLPPLSARTAKLMRRFADAP